MHITVYRMYCMDGFTLRPPVLRHSLPCLSQVKHDVSRLCYVIGSDRTGTRPKFWPGLTVAPALAYLRAQYCAHTMQDAKSWRTWRLLVAMFVLVELERAASKVTWELVQPLAPSFAQAPATSETAAITTAPKPHSNGSPWPVSTVEVSSIWLAAHASVALRMHLAVRHTPTQCAAFTAPIALQTEFATDRVANAAVDCPLQCSGDNARLRVCRLYNVTLWGGKLHLHSEGDLYDDCIARSCNMVLR
jgi:hypothetical protein